MMAAQADTEGEKLKALGVWNVQPQTQLGLELAYLPGQTFSTCFFICDEEGELN